MRFDLAANTFEDISGHADKISFVGADKSISWSELKTLSDKICDKLQGFAAPPAHPILVYGEKEIFFMAAVLSCYRLHLPFVPLTPEIPPKRIEQICQLTGSQLMIICGDYDRHEAQIVLTSELNFWIADSKFERSYPGVAYIAFTSGSSGEPKGVLVTRNNLIAFTEWFCKNFPVDANTVFINQASFLFDISLADLFGALATGGSAVFNTPTQVRDATFFERIKKYKGNYWNSTPSFVSVCLANREFNAQHFPDIKCFTLSGEALAPSLAKELHHRFPGIKIINAYGPTEACIFSSFAQIEAGVLAEKKLPISAWPAEHLLIEDHRLIITGAQVAQGYLRGAGFNGLFNTGDLVEEHAGYLYYKGRTDDQLKFNGYRIELGEIRSVLEDHPAIQKAECVPLEVRGQIKRLIAFVQMKQGRETDLASVKEELKKRLPHYMLPSEIIPVQEFPHTASFKTDRKKLLDTYLNL